MSITHYRRLVRFINKIMGFLTVVPVFLLVLQYLNASSLTWTLILPLAVVLLSYCLQEYVHSFLLFTAGNLLCLGVPAGIWTASARLTAAQTFLTSVPGALDPAAVRVILTLAYACFAVTLILLNFTIRLRHREEYLGRNLSVFWLAVPALVQILCLAISVTAPVPWILLCSMIWILLYFINEYLLNYLSFLEEVRDTSEVPIGQINSSNTWLLSAFFLLSGILMTVSCFLPVGSLFSTLGHALLVGIKFLLRLIGRLFHHDPAVSEAVPDTTTPSMETLDMGPSEASPFWLMMEKIMQVVLIAVLVIGGIALILYGIFRLVKAFYSRTALETDRVEFLNPFDRKEKLERTTTSAPTLWERLFGNSPEQRIRKTWYKIIRNRVPDASAPLTPEELIQDIGRTGAEKASVSDLTKIYEKARYSNHNCTKEEAAAARQLADTIQRKGKKL